MKRTYSIIIFEDQKPNRVVRTDSFSVVGEYPEGHADNIAVLNLVERANRAMTTKPEPEVGGTEYEIGWKAWQDGRTT